MKFTRQCLHRGCWHTFPLQMGTYGFEYDGSEQVLIISTNNSWKPIRAVLRPMITAESVQKFLTNLQDAAKQLALLAAGVERAEVDVYELVSQLMLKNILRVSIGMELPDIFFSSSSRQGNGADISSTDRSAKVL